MSDTDRNRIIFLSVPENLRGRIDSMAGDNFSIDPDIPIPVEIPEGVEKLPTEDLSWEMIVSGMLRVIALGEENPDRIDYYRHFVLAVKPDVFEEFTEAAILKARNGDFDLSLEILDTLRGLFPGSPSVLLNRALVLEEKAAALEQRRNSVPLRFICAASPPHEQEVRQAQAQAVFAAAEAAFVEALDINPPFPEAYFNAGFFYMGRKDFSKARELFAVYADFDEDNPKKSKVIKIIREIDENGLGDENFNEAYKLIMQGNEEAGMNRVREFIEQYPAVWNGWFVLGWALRRTGRWKDGAAAFSKAVELGGGNSDTRNELAICLMETGDLNGARRELEAALHNDPENVKIISNLGVLALKSGAKEEAAAFFRTVLELDPEDPIAREQVTVNREQ